MPGAIDRILHRPVCDLLGCRYPLVLAGEGGAARSALVSAVTEAGGFGLLGMVGEPPELIRDEVAKVRAATDRRFGVSLAPAATEAGLLRRQADLLLELKVPAVCLMRDLAAELVARCRDAGMLVLCQVGSAAEALAAQQAAAQIPVAKGPEAGGHALLPEIVAAVQLPVLASAGTTGGAGLASALSLGAQGAVLDAAHDASASGLQSIAADAAERLGAGLLPARPAPPRVVLSSPVCYADEMENVYRDRIAPAALVDALNELLEAERAGARIALALLLESGGEDDALLRRIHRSEVQWCGMLMAAIRELQGTPSTRTGDFFAKVMALPDLPARLALLNRGQGWVVKRLQALLPRIDDDALCERLGAMLAAHRDNIGHVDAHLGGG